MRQPRRYGNVNAEVIANNFASRLAIPKPQFVEEGEPVDKSTLAFPVNAPGRDRDFLTFVRSEVCAVNAGYNHECGGKTEAAHLEVEGKAIKADDLLTAPLCTAHHYRQHSLGTDTFQITYGINLWQINARLQARYHRRTK